jgi:hypothetical protein
MPENVGGAVIRYCSEKRSGTLGRLRLDQFLGAF